jgi:hypothetical protein
VELFDIAGQAEGQCRRRSQVMKKWTMTAISFGLLGVALLAYAGAVVWACAIPLVLNLVPPLGALGLMALGFLFNE